MGLLDKIVDDIFDDREPRRNRPPEQKNSDKMFIGELLGAYFYKEDIQSFCEDADLKTTGTKEELIGILLNESKYDVTDYLDALEMDHLKDLCDEFDEKVSGTKGELIKRIVPHIIIKEEVEIAPQKTAPAQQVTPISALQPPATVMVQTPQHVSPPMIENREELIRKARCLESAFEFGDAITIYKKYEMYEDVKRCNLALHKTQMSQQNIQMSIDQSTHIAHTDNRNISNVNNIDNRDAVINRSQFGANQPAQMRSCPYCKMEFNLPELPRVCSRCGKQLMQ